MMPALGVPVRTRCSHSCAKVVKKSRNPAISVRLMLTARDVSASLLGTGSGEVICGEQRSWASKAICYLGKLRAPLHHSAAKKNRQGTPCSQVRNENMMCNKAHIQNKDSGVCSGIYPSPSRNKPQQQKQPQWKWVGEAPPRLSQCQR